MKWFKSDSEMIFTGGNGASIIMTNTKRHKGGKMTIHHCEVGQYKRSITAVALDDQDKYAYCGTKSGDIMCVHTKSAKFKSLFRHREFGKKGVQSIEFIEDNGEKWLLAGCGDGLVGLIKLLDATTMELDRVVQFSGSVTSISTGVNFKGGLDTFVGTSKGNQYICNSSSLQYELRGTSHHSQINDICFPRHSSELFVTCSDEEIRIWNSSKLRELLRIQVPNVTCECVTLTPDGSRIVSGWSDTKIRIFKPKTGKLDYVISNAHQGSVTSIVCSEEDERGEVSVVSGGSDGRVRIWKKTHMVASLKEHKSAVTQIKFTKDNSNIVSASADGSCIVWDFHRHVRLSAFFDTTMFRSILYHPDESQILTCGSDRKITYWDATDGEAIRVIEGSEAEINSIDIEPTGTLFVSGGNDKLVRVWEYDAGKMLASGQGHSSGITRLKISPDQSKIVSVGSEGAILIWNMGSAEEGGESKESKYA